MDILIPVPKKVITQQILFTTQLCTCHNSILYYVHITKMKEILISYILDNPFLINQFKAIKNVSLEQLTKFSCIPRFQHLLLQLFEIGGVGARELSGRFAIKSISEILKWQITENPILKCVVGYQSENKSTSFMEKQNA